MEPRFGHDFGDVRVHTDAAAVRTARAVGARAYTVGPDVVFGHGQFRPDNAAGQRLIAHELAHVIQQRAGGVPFAALPRTVSSPSDAAEREADRVADAVSTAPGSTSGLTTPRITDDVAWPTPQLQRQVAPRQPTTDPLTAPLTGAEWRAIDIWRSRGEVVAGPLTADPEHNADLIAGAIFCDRWMDSPDWGKGDPLLCLVPEITAANPRVQVLRRMVTARGPIIHWPAVAPKDRLSYVMSRLINVYHYPVNGAAGIVGNLFAESGVLPSRIEGSAPATPMRSASFTGRSTDFDPDEVMSRSDRADRPVGPRSPGIGLAQWTSEPRRSNLFSGGSSILFDMDGQVDYLVSELHPPTGLR